MVTRICGWLACGVMLILTPSVNAAIITGAAPGTVQPSGGAFITPTPSAANTANTFRHPIVTPPVPGTNPPGDPNWVNLSARATDLHQPMSLAFTVLGTGAHHEYFFTVTMLHDLQGQQKFKPIGPTEFRLLNGTLPAGDFARINFDRDPANGGDSSPQPTSSYQGTPLAAGWGTQTLIFGGLNGGGGELYNGQTATFRFRLDIPDMTGGTFFLQLTPNPEPATLLLGGIGLLTGSCLCRRRWKKKPVAETADAA